MLKVALLLVALLLSLIIIALCVYYLMAYSVMKDLYNRKNKNCNMSLYVNGNI